jgi:hypothetical protein
MTREAVTRSTRREILKTSALVAAGIAIDGPHLCAEPTLCLAKILSGSKTDVILHFCCCSEKASWPRKDIQ